jgi:hypothetical protein
MRFFVVESALDPDNGLYYVYYVIFTTSTPASTT